MSHEPLRVAARVFAGCLVLAFAVGAPAATYKWTDAEGNVHFSDKPPPEHVEKYEGPERPTAAEWEEQKAERERRRRQRTRPGAGVDPASVEELEEAAAVGGESELLSAEYTCGQASALVAGYRQKGKSFDVAGSGGRPRPVTAEEREDLVQAWEQTAERLCREGGDRRASSRGRREDPERDQEGDLRDLLRSSRVSSGEDD